ATSVRSRRRSHGCRPGDPESLYPRDGSGETAPVERGIGFERVPQFLCGDPERVVLEDRIRVVYEGFILVNALQAPADPAGSDREDPGITLTFPALSGFSGWGTCGPERWENLRVLQLVQHCDHLLLEDPALLLEPGEEGTKGVTGM